MTTEFCVPHFAYRGRDGGGKLVQGVIEGADTHAVADRLMETGVTPLDISLSAAPGAAGSGLLQRLQEK
ncbi:MAG: type II secretion system F family protein, partial [Betaproteobacteria bacterium]|nr:type II secretion system F family protein [Betaproteobacteria bacterium]